MHELAQGFPRLWMFSPFLLWLVVSLGRDVVPGMHRIALTYRSIVVPVSSFRNTAGLLHTAGCLGVRKTSVATRSTRPEVFTQVVGESIGNRELLLRHPVHSKTKTVKCFALLGCPFCRCFAGLLDTIIGFSCICPKRLLLGRMLGWFGGVSLFDLFTSGLIWPVMGVSGQ